MSNDSEMKHRSHQSSSEDARSRNKRSDVLQKFKKMDGVTRRQAIEALWKPSVRTELWYRKDLTCRILLVLIYERLNGATLCLLYLLIPQGMGNKLVSIAAQNKLNYNGFFNRPFDGLSKNCARLNIKMVQFFSAS